MHDYCGGGEGGRGNFKGDVLILICSSPGFQVEAGMKNSCRNKGGVNTQHQIPERFSAAESKWQLTKHT